MQTRKDRMIENYYDKIRTSKQEKLFHETVFQIQKRNPSLYVFSAHLHMDEETPHLHIDFVPYTTGNKRELDTRVSLK